MLHGRSWFWKSRRLVPVLALGISFVPGCVGTQGADAEWPPLAKQWYERAGSSYRSLDMEDATVSIEQALKVDPARSEVRELAAKIALSELDYKTALLHTQGLETGKGRALRARALWYSGQVSEAADQLDALLADPTIKDPWAQGTVKLARQARDKSPFDIRGDMLAVMEMPRLQNTAMVVPVELNGQPVLALIATGTPEVVIDSAGNRTPSWVTLRFAERIEVRDVPALTQDLSGLSRDLGAPIKLLLGTHLLRHLNATVDFLGRQFVVRSFDPPPPPAATKIPLSYIRGGGMALSSRIGPSEEAPPFTFLVDTASAFTIVLDESAWKRAGADPNAPAIPGARGMKQASVGSVQLGAYDIPNVPVYSGVPIVDVEEKLDLDLDGLVGSGLLGAFRVTFTEGGRAFWLEDAATFVDGAAEIRPEAAPTEGSAAPAGPAAQPPSGAVPVTPTGAP
jgi:hypothetical protein